MNFARLVVSSIAFLLTCAAHAQSTDRYLIRTYSTKTYQASFPANGIQDGYGYNHLPGPSQNQTTGEYDVREKRVVFSIQIADGLAATDDELDEDEILLVLAELQGRQHVICYNHETPPDETMTAGFFTGVYVGKSATFNQADETNKFMITEHNGQNLAFSQHLRKDTNVKVGTWKPPLDDDVFVPLEHRFVNLYAYVLHDCDEVYIDDVPTTTPPTVSTNSQLTVIRLTPVQPPHQGYTLNLPQFTTSLKISDPANCNYDPETPPTAVTSTSPTCPDLIYRIDLDNAGGPAVELRLGDIITVLGECQARYIGTTRISFVSQILLVNSTGSTKIAVTPPNDFSMKAGVRERKTAVKAATFDVPSPPENTYWRYVDLVAWAIDLPPTDVVEIGDEQPSFGDPTVQGGGKLSVVRFRHTASEGDIPIGVQRYDQVEFNCPLGSCTSAVTYAPMEQVCTLINPPPPAEEVHKVVYYHTLENLKSSEYLLAGSEMEATNQDDNNLLKLLWSQLIVAETATSTEQTFNINLGNPVTIHRSSMHHGVASKVGIAKVSSTIMQGHTYYLSREIWSEDGFDGDPCVDDDGNPICTPSTLLNCTCTSSSCDVINRGLGRLFVLRFTPLLQAVSCHNECCADVDNDSVVDIDDLLAIITAWDTGPPPPTHPLRPADVIDDGSINIDDLLAVINNWGPCPPQSGEGGPPPSFPPTIAACFNTYCAELEGEAWQLCIERCILGVCTEHPEQCE